MAINNNAFSTGTNIEFGSNDLGDFWLQAQSCAVPGITLSHPEVGGRSGTQIKLQGDSVTYTELIIDVPMDKEWKVYDIIHDKFLAGLNVEKGTFSPQQFDMWLDIKTGKGSHVRKFWFYNCRISDIGEMVLNVTDDGDAINALTLTFVFDYMNYEK